MRGLLLGLLLTILLTVTILSLRPGGLRRQFTYAARRFRIVLVLGGIFVVASSVIRLAAPEGWAADYGPSIIALALVAVFLVVARDPANPPEPGSPSRSVGRPG